MGSEEREIRDGATRSETASHSSEYLTPRQVTAEFPISISGVYALARRIPSHKVPGLGLLFRRSDIIDWIELHRRVPTTRRATRSRVAESGRRGTRRACRSGDEEIAPGLTRDALKAATGL